MTMRSAGVYDEVLGSNVRTVLCTFNETLGVDSTYTCTIPVDAGWSVVDVLVRNRVVWDAATSAALVVGDAADADGYYASTNVLTTPAAVTGDPWGFNLKDDGGAYTDGRHYDSAGVITATITTNDDGTNEAGLTDILVIMIKPTETQNATKAAV